jgi:hypothetical protein
MKSKFGKLSFRKEVLRVAEHSKRNWFPKFKKLQDEVTRRKYDNLARKSAGISF